MKTLLLPAAAVLGIVLMAAALWQILDWFNRVNCDQFSCTGLLILALPVAIFLTILLAITLINLAAFFIHKLFTDEDQTT